MSGWWRWVTIAICLALVLPAATAAEDAATVVLRQPGDVEVILGAGFGN